MENTIKTFKEQSTELAKKLTEKRNACIGKQDAIQTLWDSTNDTLDQMEADEVAKFDADKYEALCDNTHFYSNINQRIEWQIDAIDAMMRALEEINSNLEELEYQDIQIRLYEGRIK